MSKILRTQKKVWQIIILFLITSSVFFVGTFVSFATDSSIQGDTVDVGVYVIALEDVDGHGVDNISRAVEGVLSACNVDTLYYFTGEWTSPYSPAYGQIGVNVSVSVVNEWDTYRMIIESASNVVIVNGHGETLPIPSSYAKEEWGDKIAEAMAYRNITWVHTASYPFYYYSPQESKGGEWGEEGFQRLMGQIGKGDVTCLSPGSETDIVDLHSDAEYTLLHGWPSIYNAWNVECGRPLKASDFDDCLVATIWGSNEGYMTGAIIKFSESNQINSFGFYVHVGAHKTYSVEEETDGDFYRSYVGTAQAIHTFSFRFASENAISDAENAIIEAENEGRTKGLGESRQLLQQAENQYDSRIYVSGMRYANEAMEAAEKAVKPSLLETYAVPVIILVVGSTVAVSFVLRQRGNSRKKVK